MSDTEIITASPEVTEVPNVPAPEAPPEPAPEVDSEPKAEEVVEETDAERKQEEREPWTAVAERYAEDSDYQAHTEEIRNEAHWKGQKQEAGQRKQVIQKLDGLSQQISDFNQDIANLREIAHDPDRFDRTFAQTMERHAPALQAFAQVNAEKLDRIRDHHGAWVLANFMLQASGHPDIGKPDLALPFVKDIIEITGYDRDQGRITGWNVESGFEIDGGAKVFGDFLKAVKKHWKETDGKKEYERGVKDGKSGTSEAVKAATREGKQPAKTAGSSGGSRNFSTLQEAQIAHARGEITNNRMREIRDRFRQAERDR